MKQKFNAEKFFHNYSETRTEILDGPREEKLAWFRFYFDQVYGRFFKKISKKSSILELGCNRGYLLKILEEQGYSHLVGVDLSQGDIRQARELVPRALFVEEDIFLFLERHEKSFDVIVLKALIEHIPKYRIVELLEKIYKSLSPGGVILIDVYNAEWFFANHDRYMDFTHELGFTQESLKQVMDFVFKNSEVYPIASPIQMRKRRRWLYFLSRFLFKKFLGFVEPEIQGMPIFERLLIGYAWKEKQ